jgi:alpha-glucosidase (family GH31 glycosyl hydrolase)
MSSCGCSAARCRHTNQTGVPLMRPLWFEFPEQSGLYGVEEEFLLGPGLLVKPVLEVRCLLFRINKTNIK